MADGARSAPARTPPANLDAEAAVLSACLLDGTRAALAQARALLRSGNFYADANRLVFDAITDIDDAGKAPDVVLVAQRMRELGTLERAGGAPYLAQLSDATPAVAHVADHARIVADKSRQRWMIAELGTILGSAFEELGDVRTWAQDAAQRVADVAAIDPKEPAEFFAQIVPRVLEEASCRAQHGVVFAGVDTGWREYTELIGGWKRRKQHIVAGRPGMGKTAFVLNAALNVARQGLGVIFPSAEMDEEELAQRALSIESGIDVRKIETGRMTTAEWSAVTDAAERLRKLPISIGFCPGATLGEIRSMVRLQRARLAEIGCAHVGLVIVDYLQILNGEQRQGESREGEVSRLSKGLLWMAGEFDVPVLTVSQLNRALESRSDKRPVLSDLRESGSIEQDAHTITFLYRDDYYNKRGSEWAGTMEAIVAKNRSGPTDTVRLAYVAECTRIANLTEQSELQYEWS